MSNIRQFKLSAVQEAAKLQHLPEDFLWFWSEYPRKEAKGQAYKAWRETESIRPDIEELIAAVARYADSCRFKDRNYIKLAATWLRAWCWEDE